MSTVDENIEVVISPVNKVKTVPAKLGTVLTENEYNTLRTMLKSSDHENHRMAQAILNQCDVKTSIYWIWKLAKGDSCSHRMVYLRTKASRDFRDECNLFDISYIKATEFALKMYEKKWMTPEMYKLLKPQILDELTTRNEKSNLYNVHVTIKDKFLEYDQEDKLTQLTYL